MTLSRLSIRARLAIGFAAALLLILALAGSFVYLRVSDDLDSALNDGLESRAHDLASLVGDTAARRPALVGGPVARIDVSEGFSQILDPSGRVVATTLERGTGPVLDRDEVERSTRETVVAERAVHGVEGEARIVARPASSAGNRFIVVAGASTDDKREALAGLLRAFLIGAPLAIVLASGLGYLLAGRSLAPVEAMRRRARQITLERSGERLPLPRAEDEIHQLGETLNAMLDRLEAGLARERVFVADASHELRTPLAILRAELELADNPERSPDELRGAIHSATEEIDRLTQLAEDLLVIARSDQGRLPIARERADLETLLERVRERFARRAQGGGREIAVDAPSGSVAELDPFRIEQALGNLVDNALRHGGGEVALSARLEDGLAVFEVSDQGPGFPADFESEAFERFSRADPGRSGAGAGLGLAIVRAIAVAHGGEVMLASRPGEAATTLRVAVPAEEEPQ